MKKSIKTEAEMTQILKLAHGELKVTITAFHMFKSLEDENMNPN